MTDAERIAEYLNRELLQSDRFYDWKAHDVDAAISEDATSQPARLMAMLSDVRREEREACAALLRDAAKREFANTEMSHPLQTKLAMAIRGETLFLASNLVRKQCAT